MKRTGFLVALAVVAVVILIAIFMARAPREAGAPGRIPMQAVALYREAAGTVSPDSLGPAWPGPEVLQAVRTEWRALGSRDSSLCEELTRAGLYTEGTDPFILPNVPQTRLGADLDIRERLRFGETLLGHPRWRMGALRHFPVLAAVLSSPEKALLAYLAGPNRKPTLSDSLAVAIDVSREQTSQALAGLESVGWVTRGSGSDSTRYSIVDPSIRQGNALQFATIDPGVGNTVDVVSVHAAFTHMSPMLFAERVTVRGPCAATGRTVLIEVVQRKLRRGRPGNAWAADLLPAGRSNGLFVSKRTFEDWRSQHPEVQVRGEGTLPELYESVLGAPLQ